MNTYTQVTNLITQWKAEGVPTPDIIRKTAEACMGWPYVWGAYGQFCTSKNRESYANRSVCPAGEAKQIRKKCQILNGKKSVCDGCKYYPGGRVRFFDCRGFTRWLLQQVGISLQGAGATSQWNTEANWAWKGEKQDLPENLVACVFMREGKTMSHTGMYMGNGKIIHCSGEVITGDLREKAWTHFGIPKGLYAEEDLPPRPVPRPLLKKGSKGDAVKELQNLLLEKGYDLGKWGADGIFGTKTKEAVKSFQRAEEIQTDGIVGPVTWGRLYPE